MWPVAAVLFLLTGCSGGGGGGTTSQLGIFNGNWIATRTITTSTCGGAGVIDTSPITIQHSGGQVTLLDNDGNFTGTGSTSAVLTRSDGFSQINLNSTGGDSMAGNGRVRTTNGAVPCDREFTFTAVRGAATTALVWGQGNWGQHQWSR